MTHGFQKQFFYCFTWSSNQFLILNVFSFLFKTLLLIISVSLCVCPWIFCHRLATPYLTCFRVSDCFLLWMLATVHNPCHVLHAPQTTTCGIISKRIFFSVCKEWFRYWSHAFLVTNVNKFTKRLLAVRPEKETRRKKRKRETRMAIAKLLAFNANAIKSSYC